MKYLKPETMDELRKSLDDDMIVNTLLAIAPLAKYTNNIHHGDNNNKTSLYAFRHRDKSGTTYQITTHVRVIDGFREIVRFVTYHFQGMVIVSSWYDRKSLFDLINNATSKEDCKLAYAIANIIGHSGQRNN